MELSGEFRSRNNKKTPSKTTIWLENQDENIQYSSICCLPLPLLLLVLLVIRTAAIELKNWCCLLKLNDKIKRAHQNDAWIEWTNENEKYNTTKSPHTQFPLRIIFNLIYIYVPFNEIQMCVCACVRLCGKTLKEINYVHTDTTAAIETKRMQAIVYTCSS